MNAYSKLFLTDKQKQKLVSNKSTLPKISKNIYNKAMQQNTRQLKSASIRNQYPLNKIDINTGSYRQQNYLKQLLRQFGLSQYLRKIFDIGYDDLNIKRIGLYTKKEFEEFVIAIKIFPGHQVKFDQLYSYLKGLHTFPQKERPLRKVNTAYGIRNNSNKLSSKNQIISHTQKQFYNNNNNYNQLLSNNNNYLNEKSVKSSTYNNFYLDNNFKIESAKLDNDESESLINKTFKDDDSNVNTSENIDKMLKYYMIQLNEKLENSYESIEDSSLSHITNLSIQSIKQNINQLKPKNELQPISKKESTNNSTSVNNNSSVISKKPPNKLPSINKRKLSNEESQNKSHSIISNSNNKINIDASEKKNIINNIQSNFKDNINKNKLISNTLNDEPNRNNIPSATKYYKTNSCETKEDLKSVKKDDTNSIITSKEESNVLNKNESTEHNNTENNKNNENITNKAIEDIVEDYSFEKDDAKDDIVVSDLIENKEILEQLNDNDLIKKNKSEPTQPKEENEETYDPEKDLYENLRLNKSFENDYLRQNVEQFDIEYMCRCLGLALMKHIESGNDKQHITEIENYEKSFLFFNSLYNSKKYILSSFFNSTDENKISNLDLLEKEENDLKQNISFVNHFQKKKDFDLVKQQEEKDKKNNKLHSNYSDIEKDIKFIDEFFSVGTKKVKNYKNLSETTKNILCKDLSYINEVDSELVTSRIQESVNESNNKSQINDTSKQSNEKAVENTQEVITENCKENEIKTESNKNEDNTNTNVNNSKNEESKEDNKFTSVSNTNNKESNTKIEEDIKEDLEQTKEKFESGSMESDYVIDVSTADKLKNYLLKESEIFDDDYYYPLMRIQSKKYIPPPDPQTIFDFCANIMILTKMEKEVIIVTLIYIERFIFNTGILITSRNWRRFIFTAMIIASKLWDDDSFENNHFAQVFTHLKIGEINLMEKTFLELINYKSFVKCSEYFKYFFIIKSIALMYNYNGTKLVPISVKRMIKIQEYAYQMQKKMRKIYKLNNSSEF